MQWWMAAHSQSRVSWAETDSSDRSTATVGGGQGSAEQLLRIHAKVRPACVSGATSAWVSESRLLWTEREVVKWGSRTAQFGLLLLVPWPSWTPPCICCCCCKLQTFISGSSVFSHCHRLSGIGCPGKWWNYHPWKCSKVMWMWHLETGFVVSTLVLGKWLESMTIEVLSNRSNSMILYLCVFGFTEVHFSMKVRTFSDEAESVKSCITGFTSQFCRLH